MCGVDCGTLNKVSKYIVRLSLKIRAKEICIYSKREVYTALYLYSQYKSV
jgi:hypothetical protein